MSAIEWLEQRVMPTPQIAVVHEAPLASSANDTVPVINDSGVALFAGPEGPLSGQFSWKTNQGVALPGLTQGYRKSGDVFPPDLNNSGIAVLTQYTNSTFTEQELVVYDVVAKKRLMTITTLGAFRSFRNPQINEYGTVAVIAEKDNGEGGIYYLQNGSLVPALERRELVDEMADLTLLKDDRAVFGLTTFRSEGAYFAVNRNGETVPFAGTPARAVTFWNSSSYSSVSSLINAWEPVKDSKYPYVTITFGLRKAAPSDRAISIHVWTTDLTATADSDYTSVDTIIQIPPGEIRADIKINIAHDDVWEGGVEAFTVNVELLDDPWQDGFRGMGGASQVVAIMDRDSSQYYGVGQSVFEEQPGTSEIKLKGVFGPGQPEPPAPQVPGPPIITYQVIPISTTSDQVGPTSGSIPAERFKDFTLPLSVTSTPSSPKVNDVDRVFLVLFQSDEYTAISRGSLVRIKDGDFIPYSHSAVDINENGDFAAIQPGTQDKIFVVSGDHVVEQYSEQEKFTFSGELELSNNRDLVFSAYDVSTRRSGLYSGPSPTSDLLITENQQLTPGHNAKLISSTFRNYSLSSNGKLIFASEYWNPSNATDDGLGVYALNVPAKLTRRNILGGKFVIEGIPGGEEAGALWRWGDTVTVSFGVINQGNVDFPASKVRFVMSKDINIELTDLPMTNVSGVLDIPSLKPGERFDGQVQIVLPNTPPSGFAESGSVYLGMISDAEDATLESDESDNYNFALGFDKAELKLGRPHFVNVLIHGYNPPTQSLNEMWAKWKNFGQSLLDFADSGEDPAVENTTDVYVAQWNSEAGFNSALINQIAILALEYYLSDPPKTDFSGNPINEIIASALAEIVQKILEADKENAIALSNGLARKAASAIVEDLTSGGDKAVSILGDPDDDSVEQQWIHVAGHSRGAAVGAEVVRQLDALGYNVSQYTSLDGYSTDWKIPYLDWQLPFDGLADIDIVKTLKLGGANIQINGLVEQGLFGAGVSWGEDYIEKFLSSKLSIDVDLPSNYGLFKDLTFIRAPGSREGMTDVLFSGPPGNPSNHTNISDLFFDKSAENRQRNPMNAFDILLRAGAERLSTAGFTHEATSSESSPLSSQEIPNSVFIDGDFEKSGHIRDLIDALGELPDFGDPVINEFVKLLKLKSFGIDSSMVISGIYDLKKVDGDYSLSLTQSNSTAFATPVMLSESANRISFSLFAEQPGVGDSLVLKFNGEEVGRVELGTATVGELTTVTFDISRFAGEMGEFEFVFEGAVTDPASILLDDLSIVTSTSPPVLEPIPDMNSVSNGNVIRIPLGLSDTDTAVTDLAVFFSWSDKTLVQEGYVWITLEGGKHILNILPVTNGAGTVNFTIQVRDGSTLPDGSLIYVEDSFQLRLTAPNRAPVLNANGNPNVSNIHEDISLTSNVGNFVNDLIGRMAPQGGITDPDAGALKGMAVIGANQDNGTWQFTLDRGTTWANFGSISSSGALLLAVDSKVRFLPKKNYSGPSGFTFVAWDRTAGLAGQKVDARVRGGATAFSSQKDSSYINVNPINDAPVLNFQGNPTISRATGDSPSVSSLGTMVSSIVARMKLAGGITDPDTGALQGIAVIGANQSGGTWQFSLNNGVTWKPVGTTSNTAALLLAADNTTRIRFVPSAVFSGQSGFTFVAWDRTSGANGSAVNATARGGSSSLSVDKENCILLDGGNVQASTSNGTISLTGDDFANDINLTFNTNGTVTLQGNNGTWINGHAGPVTISATALGSVIMKDGRDRLRVTSQRDINLIKDSIVDMGNGDDFLRVERLVANKKSEVRLGAGRDRIEMLDSVFSSLVTTDFGSEDTVFFI